MKLDPVSSVRQPLFPMDNVIVGFGPFPLKLSMSDPSMICEDPDQALKHSKLIVPSITTAPMVEAIQPCRHQ